MKSLKKITTLIVTFALFSLHIETGAIAWSSAYARADNEPNFEQVDLPNINNESQQFVDEISTPTTPQTDTTGQVQADSAVLDYSNASCSIGKMTVNQFMLMVTLMLGPIVGLSCFATISGKIFTAGTAIYLIKEIMNYSKFKNKKTSNEEMLATLDGNTEDAQIETFLLAEQQERDAASALGSRADNAKLLATTMYLAAAAATVEFVARSIQYGVCVAGTIGTGACNCGQATAFFDRCGAPKTPCSTPAEDSIYAINYSPQMFTDIMVASNGESFSNQYACYSNQQDNLYDLEAFVEYNKMTAKPEDSSSNFEDALKMALNILMGTAHAKDSENANKGGILSALGISGAVIGIVAAFMLKKQVTFQAVLSVGWVRALLFGGLGLFATFAAKELKKAEDCANGNADKYKNLAEQLERALMSQARMAGMIKPSVGFRTQLQNLRLERDKLSGPNAGAICLVGNPGEYRVDAQCACKQNNSCTKADFSTTQFSSLGLPSSFGASTNGLANGANSLFSGNLAGADSAFGSLNQNAANIDRLRKKALGNAIAELKKDKRFANKKIDLEKADTAATNLLGKDLNEAIRKINSSAGASLANASPIPSAPSEASPEKAKELLASIKSNVQQAAKNKGSPLDGFKFDFGEEEPNAAQSDALLDQGQALSEFETNESDISDRPNESIFKIITVRYFKSAYPRFFEEEAAQKQNLD